VPTKEIKIPTMPPVWPTVKRETPVTPRENLMLALNHEKPYWMADFYASSQVFVSSIAQDAPIERTKDTTDWFGVEYKFSEAQGSNTPMGNVLNDITEWEEKIKWPDLSQFDWASDGAQLERDESLALYMRMSNGPFERLHALEGFEQALIDLITEPEAVRDFLERLVDFKIELFNCIRDHIPLDYIMAADDWGTARAPFFSTDTFEKTILEPTKRFVKAVQARGTKFVSHCCGAVDPFVPYMVEEIGFDAIEIQTNLNDLPGILEKYGDRVTVKHAVKSEIVYDPDTTEEQIRAIARDIVDTYGAHVVPGSGVVMGISSGFENIYYALEDEIYTYSKSRYEGLRAK
jgi:uroporphyrinogen-III decarboxylase